MKRRILFVMESLRIGGAEKSLVTILSRLSQEPEWEIELLLFQPSGDFISYLPRNVRLLRLPEAAMRMFGDPKLLFDDLLFFLRCGQPHLAFARLAYFVCLAWHKCILRREYIGWRWIRKAMSQLPGRYDTAISFLEKKTAYFVIERVNAAKKIVWIHIDYRHIEYDAKLDQWAFALADKLVAVSAACRERLLELFHLPPEKVCVIPNMVDRALIRSMSLESTAISPVEGRLVLATVARLTAQKGIDIAVDACAALKRSGVSVLWLVVGDGEEYLPLQRKIAACGLSGDMLLLGAKSNPYPYMRLADIYVQPSRFEGFGITIAEAKALEKPIIAADIPAFHELLQNRQNALLVPLDGASIAEAIQELHQDSEMRSRFIKTLGAETDEPGSSPYQAIRELLAS
ncbi:MAG TPA: glycosyltransferase [Oligoflexia bacterium]|nr:glycosyltransferase [Oligoflexia bacterium]